MTVNADTVTAEAADFLDDFRALSRFGATDEGGVERQAGTIADVQTRAWFTSLLERDGFRIAVDGIGNIFGLKEFAPGRPYVLVGSHLDSQPYAGRFDGAYGVAAGLHAAKRIASSLEGSPEPKYNLAVVDWFNEEGSRFEPSMFGSAVFTGKLALEDALTVTDAEGVSVEEALRAMGHLGADEIPPIAAYAEIHIEQGRTLEDAGAQIGLVHSNWAFAKFDVWVLGEQAHTGATAIADRHDALLGASRLVVLLREIADRFDTRLHTSVGRLTVTPNSPVVVPRQVDLLMDLRSADETILEQSLQILHDGIARIEEETRTTVQLRLSQRVGVTPYQPAGVELAERVCEDLGLSSLPVYTLAGHDSTMMKDLVPTVMLFVPSKDGISHSVREFTDDADLLAGVDALEGVTRRLLDGALDGT